MTTWYRKDLGNGVEAFGPSGEILKAFLTFMFQRVTEGTYSYDLALFSRYDLSDDNVAVYFSPSAEAFALMFDAIPCDKPTPGNRLALMAGDDRSWDIHFPEHRRGASSVTDL